MGTPHQTKTPAYRPGYEGKSRDNVRHYRASSRPQQAPYIGIDGLLARLNGVRKTGPNRWMARCPAREDRTPSLSIRLLDNGRILLHDFGGSGFDDILAAIGLEPLALIPEHLRHRREPIAAEPHRAPIPCCDALRVLAFQANVVLIAAHDVANGMPLSEAALDQVARAVLMLEAAMQAAGGAR